MVFIYIVVVIFCVSCLSCNTLGLKYVFLNHSNVSGRSFLLLLWPLLHHLTWVTAGNYVVTDWWSLTLEVTSYALVAANNHWPRAWSCPLMQTAAKGHWSSVYPWCCFVVGFSVRLTEACCRQGRTSNNLPAEHSLPPSSLQRRSGVRWRRHLARWYDACSGTHVTSTTVTVRAKTYVAQQFYWKLIWI